MANGDDIRKKTRIKKEEAERAVQNNKEAAGALKGEWLGNVARGVESSLKNYTGGNYISIPHPVPYEHGMTLDEIKTTAGFKALRDACKEHNVDATLVQRSSMNGFVMHVELLPETEFSNRTLARIEYR